MCRLLESALPSTSLTPQAIEQYVENLKAEIGVDWLRVAQEIPAGPFATTLPQAMTSSSSFRSSTSSPQTAPAPPPVSPPPPFAPPPSSSEFTSSGSHIPLSVHTGHSTFLGSSSSPPLLPTPPSASLRAVPPLGGSRPPTMTLPSSADSRGLFDFTLEPCVATPLTEPPTPEVVHAKPEPRLPRALLSVTSAAFLSATTLPFRLFVDELLALLEPVLAARRVAGNPDCASTWGMEDPRCCRPDAMELHALDGAALTAEPTPEEELSSLYKGYHLVKLGCQGVIR